MVSWERWPTDTGLTSDVANTPDNDGGVITAYITLCITLVHMLSASSYLHSQPAPHYSEAVRGGAGC